ncbi:ribosomal protein L6 [Hamiltosporidium tvaerminnensis]|uniref:Ribosomal protein L6 n=2 Tax=Hamiltosporidium TaxID=1176354 RepID=A0A4Q9KVX4_9MICR|nr:60S ribosomal protein L9B [Hamiltosporidium tvaerminnensis]TBT97557.1 ribosomal protein L6 [Hamiltosporidium tvaerminnensis]TBT99062.1 ribosomal protein L6 [Hamiltosporidium magnivora]TBU06903.1 ribosomal protein L6 [Hamiltosporidium magnivora]TBU06946.1 ribosomal protein L6 [Hamiltosporidium tvaerminnensis]
MKKLYKEEIVKIPEGCSIEINNKIITIKGPKCTLIRDLSHITVTFALEDNNLICKLWNGTKKQQSKIITCASIIRNAIKGCMTGFRYVLTAVYKHFPIGIEIVDNGKTVIVKNFVGEKAIRKYQMIGESYARLGDEKDTLVIEGPSIEDVSQSAGNIQNKCRVLRYDDRLFLDGIYVSQRGIIEGH